MFTEYTLNHGTPLCNNFLVARRYQLKRRAVRQAETRLRIVKAAIQLHRTKGPARTTVSDVARLAGVQRHTVYRYFPDEWELGLACSGLFMEEHPLPEPSSWRALPGRERLVVGLGELYAYYERVEDMLACVLRDAEVHPPTREVVEVRASEPMRRIREALAEGLPQRRSVQAVLDLALDFHAWRRLRDSGLAPPEAAELMASLLLCAG